MSCKGLCTKSKYIVLRGAIGNGTVGSFYSKGIKRCTTCSEYLKYEGNRCICR